MTFAIKQVLAEALEDIRLDVLSALSSFSFSLTQSYNWDWNTLWKTLESSISFTSGKESILVLSLIAGSFFLFLLSWLSVSTSVCQDNGSQAHTSRLDGKTAVITGAVSGVGYETALDLARRGAKVIMACGNTERGEMAAQKIRAEVRNTSTVIPMVKVETVDLAEMEDVRRLAGRLVENGTPVDILVCNGSVAVQRLYKTETGLELMMATNHLSFFLLVNLLLPSIARSKGTIIMVTADLHRKAKLELDNLNCEKYFEKSQTFANTQLANLLFIAELSARCAALHLPVTANCAEIDQPRTGWIHRVSARDAAQPVITLARMTGVTGQLLSGGKITNCDDHDGHDGQAAGQSGLLWGLSTAFTNIMQEEVIV